VTRNAVHRSRGIEASERATSARSDQGEAGSADLATKGCHLVAQDEDLGVLGGGVPSRQPKESEGAMDQALEEGEHHGKQPRRLHPGWSRRWLGVFGPFRINLVSGRTAQ
jgi:hypothetical protein